MRNGSGLFVPDCPIEERPEWMKAYSASLCGVMRPLPDPGKEMTHDTFAFSRVFFHGWKSGQDALNGKAREVVG